MSRSRRRFGRSSSSTRRCTGPAAAAISCLGRDGCRPVYADAHPWAGARKGVGAVRVRLQVLLEILWLLHVASMAQKPCPRDGFNECRHTYALLMHAPEGFRSSKSGTMLLGALVVIHGRPSPGILLHGHGRQAADSLDASRRGETLGSSVSGQEASEPRRSTGLAHVRGVLERSELSRASDRREAFECLVNPGSGSRPTCCSRKCRAGR